MITKGYTQSSCRDLYKFVTESSLKSLTLFLSMENSYVVKLNVLVRNVVFSLGFIMQYA